MDGHQLVLSQIWSRSRRTKNLTAGLGLIFRGLNFSRNADIGQIGHLWMGTNVIPGQGRPPSGQGGRSPLQERTAGMPAGTCNLFYQKPRIIARAGGTRFYTLWFKWR